MRMRIRVQAKNAPADFARRIFPHIRDRMADTKTIVRNFRKSQGLTQTQLGEAIGVGQSTIVRWEAGAEPMRENWISLMQFAEERGVSLPDPWLVKAASGGAVEGLWVVGYVGAGSEVLGIDDHMQGAGLEHVDPGFPVAPGVVAVLVRGDSMWPKYEDGELVGYYREQKRPDELIGTTCIVKLIDGRYFVKRIHRGSEPGLHTLRSYNAPDIEDVVIEWCGEIRFSVPKGQWRPL